MRKTKFGINLDEIIIKSPLDLKKKIIPLCKEVLCSLCQENKTDPCINYVNCKLQGTKKIQIGRYKGNDLPICSRCIVQCEKVKVKDTVKFYYLKKTKKRWGRFIYKKSFNVGEVIDIYDNVYLIKLKNKEIEVTRGNIIHKLNTCPWCRSHRFIRWQLNTQKFPKKKCKKN
jgi:hypothetical protein